MTLLIYSGLLYLLGVSIILAIKPSLMFSEDGNWKEFGLGRSPKTHTWMPFWLFTILWAMISYAIILIVASHTGLGGVYNYTNLNIPNETIIPENVSGKTRLLNTEPIKRPKRMDEMKNGYYILDANETAKKGVPKYIYLGPEAPNLIYNHTSATEGETN